MLGYISLLGFELAQIHIFGWLHTLYMMVWALVPGHLNFWPGGTRS